MQGRLEGQAPDIDPVVYLTDCDPSDLAAGSLISARIVGASGYDLLATPVLDAHPSPRDRSGTLSWTRLELQLLYCEVAVARFFLVGRCPLFVFQGTNYAADSSTRSARLRAAAERVAGSYGLEMFDVQLRREPIGMVLRVIIDGRTGRGRNTRGQRRHRGLPAGEPGSERGARRRGRIRTAGARGDVHLEVSSPGLDRPLRHEADFRRFAGRLAKIVTTEPIERQIGIRRSDRGVEDGAVVLEEGQKDAPRAAREDQAGHWTWSFGKS